MDPDVLAQAAHWHARLADAPDGPSRHAATAAFQAWCGMREEHGRAFVAVTRLGTVARELAEQPALRDVAAAAHARIAARRRRQWRFRAAVIGGAVIMTPVAALTIRHLVRPAAPAPGAAAPSITVYQTRAGERKLVTLNGATRVLLDTASSLSVRGDVLRIRGQALVMAGADGIAVTLPAMTIRLRQAELNVRSDAAQTAVFAQQHAAVAAVDGAPAPLTIGPGQILTMDANRPRIAVAADPASLVSWQRGWLLFDDVPLARAAAEINRYRRQPIRLAPAVHRLRISGSFRTDDNADFLGAVAATLPATVASSQDGPTIMASRPAEK